MPDFSLAAVRTCYNSAMGKTKEPHEGENQRINLKKLAALLHLSQTTISLVLNDSPAARSIPQQTRDRVFEAARKFNYRPNYFARSLRQSRSMSVAVLTPDLSEGYFTLVMNGVQATLLGAHYFYFTASHYWDKSLIEDYPRKMMERAVDGFLLLNTYAEVHIPLPVVAVSAHLPTKGVTNIVVDHLKAAQLALSHLQQLGHSRIALMRGPEIIPDSEYRWKAILEVARISGVQVSPHLMMHLETSNWSPELGYRPMCELLQRTRDFTAVFCFNDISAIGAIRAIQDAGLRVPEDISVVGFDDAIGAAYHSPSLTTVRQPLETMGREGARILLERIAHPHKQFPAEIVMQPELIARESTCPAPVASLR